MNGMLVAFASVKKLAMPSSGLAPTLAGTTQFRSQAALVPDETTVQIPLFELQIVAVLLVVAILLLVGVTLRVGRRKKQPRER